MTVDEAIEAYTKCPLREPATGGFWGDQLRKGWDYAQKLFVVVAPSECTHEFNATATLVTTTEPSTKFWKAPFPPDYVALRGADVQSVFGGDYYQARIDRMEQKFFEERSVLFKAAKEESPIVLVWDAFYGAPLSDTSPFADALKIFYRRNPTTIVNGSDQLEVNAIYEPILNYAVCAWALSKNNRHDGASFWWQKWLVAMRAIGAAWVDVEKMTPPWVMQRGNS
jgi:hypothetical protein